MKVMDVMTYPIVTVSPDATVFEAISIMVSGSRGSVLVARQGLLKEAEGIVTTTQIFARVLAPGLDPKTVRVSEIMTPAPLVTISPEAPAKEAAQVMIRHNIRRLPVVQGGALVGIVTSKDLLRCVE
ncbi:MAG: Methylated protein [Methanosaeta sp. PtaB.Bin039]|nr:MAG: Methylated protein [Methanosaeta sp. PtaB.Bin039]OPY44382.1 MAG: Methylated protein [Methanosaeta sp. PtaU1.Bin028]HOT06246.1 CBS domain-containing protein [Methanotrichaceae archaeon]HQF15444.1 CBS domain-containing protein [Methanotrichaceae archaeon]HQI90179.1 CBS domain-containing protein [Methanotrichaceae archaeon]